MKRVIGFWALLVNGAVAQAAPLDPNESEPTATASSSEAAPPRGIRSLRYDLPVDLAVTIAGATVWVGSEVLASQLPPASCAWCDRNADGSDALNGLDRSIRDALRWSSTGTADTLSSVTGFALAPLTVAGLDALAADHDDRLKEFPIDALVIAEATVVAADVDQAVKYLVRRERPFVHALPPNEKPNTRLPFDNNTSFYSGHTTVAFALAASGGMVASIRGYTWAPWVWAGGFTVATLTGYLRIAADRHYFTDVFTGAIAGSAIGVTMPLLFHAPRGAKRFAFAVIPTSDGLFVNVSGLL